MSGKSLIRKRVLASLCVCITPPLCFHGKSELMTRVTAMLDEVAWLYNLRGNEYVP